jgi:DNA replication protein DnaC
MYFIARDARKVQLLLLPIRVLIPVGDIFADPVLASAIIDRIVHYSVIINIKGSSYRMDIKKRGGEEK